MKKVLLSLLTLGVVAAVGVFATQAFFSDTETSTGNTLAAGSLDLIIDIDGEIQNPLNGPLFTEDDIKPGDKGEVTISMRVIDNPSCGTISYTNTIDLDNTCTEAEAVAEGPGCPQPNGQPLLGELDDSMILTFWQDQGGVSGWQCGDNPECSADPTEGDNIRQEASEPLLSSGTMAGNHSWFLGELPTGNAFYYGLAWEVPSTVGDIAQTDSFEGFLTFNAYQKRNQFEVCEGPSHQQD